MTEEKKFVRIRIEYDGKSPAYMARVTDAETGADIQHVKSVDLRLDAADGGLVPTARLEIYLPIVDIEVTAEVTMICPCCGQTWIAAQPLQGEHEPPDLVAEMMAEIESPGFNELGEDEPFYHFPESDEDE